MCWAGKACSTVFMGKLYVTNVSEGNLLSLSVEVNMGSWAWFKKDMRTQCNAFGMMLHCRQSSIPSHLSSPDITSVPSEGRRVLNCNLWRRFRCFGYVICHVCASSFAIDCGVASSSLWQCFVNLCGFKISLKGRNIHLGTAHAKWCLSVFQFSNAVSFWN